MLIMLRREGESILIGEDVEIRILAISGSRVKVGIAAPRSIPVVAREVQLVRAENIEAAERPSKAAVDMVANLFRQNSQDKRPETHNMADRSK